MSGQHTRAKLEAGRLTADGRRGGRDLLFSILVVMFLQALALWPSLTTMLDGLQDEGAVAAPASRILWGEVPHRDFVARFMPGTIYCLSLWFAFFGETVGSLRGYFLLEVVVLVGLVQLVSCRILPRFWSEIPAGLFLATGAQLFPFVSHHWDAGIASFLAVLCLFGSFFEDEARGDWAAGVCCGLTVLFLQTKGVATCLACGVAVLLFRSSPARSLARLVLGAALPGVVFVLFLWRTGAWGQFWHQVLGITVNNYAKYQASSFSTDIVWTQFGQMTEGTLRLGFPPTGPQFWWLLRGWSFALVDLVKYAGYYPVLLVALGLSAWSCYRAGRSASSSQKLALTLLMVLTLASGFDLIRANRYRLILQMPVWGIAWAIAVHSLYRARRGVGLTVAWSVSLIFMLHGLDNVLGWNEYRFPVRTPRGLLYCRTPEVAYRTQAVMALANRYTRAGEAVFGFPDIPLHVWLSGRVNPTRVEEAVAVLTPPEELAETVALVQKHQPALLLNFPLDAELGGDYPAIPPEQMATEQAQFETAVTRGYRKYDGPGFLYYLRDGEQEATGRQPAEVIPSREP